MQLRRGALSRKYQEAFMLKHTLAGVAFMFVATASFAQMTPVGIWNTFDEKT